MSDLTDLRKRAAAQAQTGNYWAGKTLGLIDAYLQLQAIVEGAVAGAKRRDEEQQARIDDLNMKLGAAEGELQLAAQSVGAPDWPAARRLMAAYIANRPVDTVEDE